MTLYTLHPSPIGELLLIGERDAAGAFALSGLYMEEHRRGPAISATWARDDAAFAGSDALGNVATNISITAGGGVTLRSRARGWRRRCGASASAPAWHFWMKAAWSIRCASWATTRPMHLRATSVGHHRWRVR